MEKRIRPPEYGKGQKAYLRNNGQVAILDATNAGRERRATIEKYLDDHPLFFIECINDDEDILNFEHSGEN